MAAEQARRDVYRLVCFVVASARGLVDEPRLYGPLRLVDAASRLIELADRMGLADETLCQAHERMEGFKHLVTEDEAAFVAALEDVTTRLALGLRKDGPRSG